MGKKGCVNRFRGKMITKFRHGLHGLHGKNKGKNRVFRVIRA